MKAIDDLKYFYAYKVWCRRHGVIYAEADDPPFAHDDFMKGNALYYATQALWITRLNEGKGAVKYQIERWRGMSDDQ